MISKDKALEIAKRDASGVYSDLSIYEVNVTSDAGNWRVDYNVKDPNTQGGGPHYVISATTGDIVTRRYEQ